MKKGINELHFPMENRNSFNWKFDDRDWRMKKWMLGKIGNNKNSFFLI